MLRRGKNLKREADHGWPWPLDGVQDWFESFWNFISESTVGVYGYLGRSVSDIVFYCRDTLFDALDVIRYDLWMRINDVLDTANAIPNAVWNIFEGRLNSMAEDFYARHSSYDDYVRERDGSKGEK